MCCRCVRRATSEDLQSEAEEPFEQLRRARLIDSVKTLLRWDFWLAWQGVTGIEAAYPLRFDRSSMALQLASDGEGVVLESPTLAIKELKEGTLVPFSPAFPVIRLPALLDGVAASPSGIGT